MTAPLWQRALEARHVELLARATRPNRRRAREGGRRKHTALTVGATLGCWTVARILGRGHMGRSDLRFELVCTCGIRVEAFEFNARKRAKDERCTHPHRGHP